MPGALLVHVDLRPGKGAGDVADAAGVVEVDVGDATPASSSATDPELGQRGQQHLDRALAAGLDQDRALGLSIR